MDVGSHTRTVPGIICCTITPGSNIWNKMHSNRGFSGTHNWEFANCEELQIQMSDKIHVNIDMNVYYPYNFQLEFRALPRANERDIEPSSNSTLFWVSLTGQYSQVKMQHMSIWRTLTCTVATFRGDKSPWICALNTYMSNGGQVTRMKSCQTSIAMGFPGSCLRQSNEVSSRWYLGYKHNSYLHNQIVSISSM